MRSNSGGLRFMFAAFMAAFASLWLAACSGNAILPARGDAAVADAADAAVGTDRCTPGQFFSSAVCSAVSCSASGQVADRLCGSDGLVAEARCTCHGAGAPSGMCVPTAVRVSANPACMACAAGQTAQETCNAAGQWASCECVARTQFCVPNSWTNSSLCRGVACDVGYVAMQHCTADGQTYEPCACAPGNGTSICRAGTTRNGCSFSCGNGTVVAGTEVCNTGGTGYDCRQNAGTTCNTVMTVCTPGVSNGVACTNACAAGSAGQYHCNAGGTGYDSCRCVPTSTVGFCSPGVLYTTGCGAACTAGQVAQQRCNTAGTAYEATCQCTTVASGTGSCGGGTLVVRAANTSKLVRCYGNGQVWTSTSYELRAPLDGVQCGYSECVTGSRDVNGNFVEDPFWAPSTTSVSFPSIFSYAGVEGRSSELGNQTGQARLCTDARGHLKGVVAVNADRIGLCQG